MVAPLLRVLAGSALMSARGQRPVAASGDLAPADIAACRRGDRAALEAVFRAHAEPLARLLTRLVGPRAEVEDLLQDTFAAAITAFPSFRGEASVKTWLHRIAIHVAHQHLRRPRHRREVELADPDAVVDEPAAALAPERRDLARRLYHHLDALGAARRIALVLYAIEERSVDEIAVLMGASKAATRSRIFWARRALMRRMRGDRELSGALPPAGGRR
ncbi:MAG TPA: sigma-70 family RNA polymerase sigma factor [Kofleriaceae bacterium]|nr:sigma-70 family RNA polymerase sigma factor [Kofleriaceae bacterium]